MKLYTIHGEYIIIENFTQSIDNLQIFKDALNQIIILLYNKEPMPYKLFNTFNLLIKKISIKVSTNQFTTRQTEIQYYISLFNDNLIETTNELIPYRLFIDYIEQILPLKILPQYKIIYKNLLKLMTTEQHISQDLIINSSKLNLLITEINNIP